MCGTAQTAPCRRHILEESGQPLSRLHCGCTGPAPRGNESAGVHRRRCPTSQESAGAVAPAHARRELPARIRCPPASSGRCLRGCEMVDLAFADVLCAPGEILKGVYFPIGGFISLIMPIDDSAALEVGLVGNEGMFGHSTRARRECLAGACRRARRGTRIAHGRRDLSPGARTQPGTAAQDRPIYLCSADASSRKRRLARASTWSRHDWRAGC